MVENDPSGRAASPSEAGDTRERILRAARARFFRLGFARSTMADLARDLGMSKKTLYQHFRSKEEIIDALITDKAAHIAGGFEGILAEPALPFAARTDRALRHLLREINEVSPAFLHDLQRFAPAMFRRVEQVRARVAPRLWERLLREGVAGGSIRADIDPAATAGLIVALMQSLLHPENLDRLHAGPAELMRRLFDLVLSGLLTEAGRLEYDDAPILLSP